MAEVIVVHGYPGSGKTTQCERLATEGIGGATFGHISIGNQLRAIKTHTVDSRFSEYLTSPEAVSPPPDKIVNGIIFEAIEKATDTDFLLVDGYPRYAHAVNDFCQTVKNNGHTLCGMVDFTVDLDTCINRVLARDRRDDEPELDEVRRSFITFRYNRHKHTTHLALLALSAVASIEVVDAGGKKDEVFSRFKTALGRLALHS